MNDLHKLNFLNEQKKRLINRLKLIITIINNEKKKSIFEIYQRFDRNL